MEIVAIILIGCVSLFLVYESIHYQKRCKQCEEAYRDICAKYNVLKNRTGIDDENKIIDN